MTITKLASRVRNASQPIPPAAAPTKSPAAAAIRNGGWSNRTTVIPAKYAPIPKNAEWPRETYPVYPAHDVPRCRERHIHDRQGPHETQIRVREQPWVTHGEECHAAE